MTSNTDKKHEISVFLIDNIVSSFRKNRKPISKKQLLEILGTHPETEEYLSYIEYTILAKCRDGDIITKDSKGNLRFPIKRNTAGEVMEYNYIS